MRSMEDPLRRTVALSLYKQGLSHADVAKALEFKSTATLTKEMELDPLWRKEVQDAIESKFESTLAKAYELAKHADIDGEHEGSHKAMALIFRFAEKALDREHAERLLERKGTLDREAAGAQRPAQHTNIVLSGPDAVSAFFESASQQQLPANTEEVLDVEDPES